MITFQNYLELYREYRIPVFVLLIVLATFWFFRPIRRKAPGNDETLDELDESSSGLLSKKRLDAVLKLEKERIRRGFKPGWIYHQCKEKGLLSELQKLRQDGVLAEIFPTQVSPTQVSTQMSPNSAIRLDVELVPKSCWFSNLRSVLPSEKWKALKSIAYKKANYCCEICAGKGSKWPVEAHEVWEYFDETGEQKLKSIIALCPSCHEVKHFGLANVRGRKNIALNHFMRVNGWDRAHSVSYIDTQFQVWLQRSHRKWRTDLKALLNYGFTPEEVTNLELSALREKGAARTD